MSYEVTKGEYTKPGGEVVPFVYVVERVLFDTGWQIPRIEQQNGFYICETCGRHFYAEDAWNRFRWHEHYPPLEANAPIVGFRVWSTVSGEYSPLLMKERPKEPPLLYSVNKRILWPTDEPMEAVCHTSSRALLIGSHTAPGAACGCGLYAYSSFHAALDMYRFHERDFVIGAVQLWGNVLAAKLKHDPEIYHGNEVITVPGFRFRAQYARCIGIGGTSIHARQIAEIYDVPIYLPNELKLLQSVPI